MISAWVGYYRGYWVNLLGNIYKYTYERLTLERWERDSVA